MKNKELKKTIAALAITVSIVSAMIWGAWALIVGEVPVVEKLPLLLPPESVFNYDQVYFPSTSRLWDILFAPFFVLPLYWMVIQEDRASPNYFIGYYSSAWSVKRGLNLGLSVAITIGIILPLITTGFGFIFVVILYMLGILLLVIRYCDQANSLTGRSFVVSNVTATGFIFGLVWSMPAGVLLGVTTSIPALMYVEFTARTQESL